ASLRGAHRAAANGNVPEFLNQACAMLDIPGQGVQRKLSEEYLVRCFEPILTRGRYRLTKAYCKSLFDEMMVSARVMARGSRKDFSPLPAEWLFFNRLQLGFYSVLARLDVDVDYNAIERRILSRIDV